MKNSLLSSSDLLPEHKDFIEAVSTQQFQPEPFKVSSVAKFALLYAFIGSLAVCHLIHSKNPASLPSFAYNLVIVGTIIWLLFLTILIPIMFVSSIILNASMNNLVSKFHLSMLSCSGRDQDEAAKKVTELAKQGIKSQQRTLRGVFQKYLAFSLMIFFAISLAANGYIKSSVYVFICQILVIWITLSLRQFWIKMIKAVPPELLWKEANTFDSVAITVSSRS